MRTLGSSVGGVRMLLLASTSGLGGVADSVMSPYFCPLARSFALIYLYFYLPGNMVLGQTLVDTSYQQDFALRLDLPFGFTLFTLPCSDCFHFALRPPDEELWRHKNLPFGRRCLLCIQHSLLHCQPCGQLKGIPGALYSAGDTKHSGGRGHLLLNSFQLPLM